MWHLALEVFSKKLHIHIFFLLNLLLDYRSSQSLLFCSLYVLHYIRKSPFLVDFYFKMANRAINATIRTEDRKDPLSVLKLNYTYCTGVLSVSLRMWTLNRVGDLNCQHVLPPFLSKFDVFLMSLFKLFFLNF